MSDILVVGCSTSAGSGFEQPHGKIWHHFLDKNYNGHHTVTNLSRGGIANDKIFLKTVEELNRAAYDFVVVQWTSISRISIYDRSAHNFCHKFPNGPVTYDKVIPFNFGFGSPSREHKKFFEEWSKLFSPRMALKETLICMLTVAKLLNSMNQKYAFMVSRDCYMTDLALPNWQDTHEDYKDLILELPYRKDDQIEDIHQQLHRIYAALDRETVGRWIPDGKLSLESSLLDDYSDDQHHAGIKSQYNIYTSFIKYLDDNGIIL